MSIDIAKVYNGFRKSKREIGTHFSEKDFKLLYTNSKLSCLDVLEKYFHCSVCFNIDLEYIISYSGRKINLERTIENSENTTKTANHINPVVLVKYATIIEAIINGK